MKIIWNIYQKGGNVSCYCREHTWNVRTLDNSVVTCPSCGSTYSNKSKGRYIHWQPVKLTSMAQKREGEIRVWKFCIRRCTDREFLEELDEEGTFSELHEFYDLAWDILFREQDEN